MLVGAKRDFCEAMATNGISSDQFNHETWRRTVLEHAKGTYLFILPFCNDSKM